MVVYSRSRKSVLVLSALNRTTFPLSIGNVTTCCVSLSFFAVNVSEPVSRINRVSDRFSRLWKSSLVLCALNRDVFSIIYRYLVSVAVRRKIFVNSHLFPRFRESSLSFASEPFYRRPFRCAVLPLFCDLARGLFV